MLFNYLKTETFMDSIDIEDVGNCALTAYNDESELWALLITTELGWVTIKTIGPIDAEDNSVGNFFTYHKSGLEYNEKKLYKQVYDFLNNPKHKITQVFECDKEDIVAILQDIVL